MRANSDATFGSFRLVFRNDPTVAVARCGSTGSHDWGARPKSEIGHSLDETLAETDPINIVIRENLDVQTGAWGVIVRLVELRGILLPDSMKRAMARPAEAERETRIKIIAAPGQAMTAASLGVDKNTTVVFSAPLMSTIEELGSFLAGEKNAAAAIPTTEVRVTPDRVGERMIFDGAEVRTYPKG